MMRLILIGSMAAAFGDYIPDLPPESTRYESTKVTQRLAQVSNNGGPFVSRVDPVPITAMANTDWHQSGGMRGIEGVVSTKYKNKEAESRYAVIQVLNAFGHYQPEMGIVRIYPDGTRFDDVLAYKGKVFEHRVRIKDDGQWINAVVHREPENYPPGYTGLKKSCVHCHSQPGSGSYGADGLVPGGDGNFSDSLLWSVVPK